MYFINKVNTLMKQPGVKHWHGATPEKGFVQIVMNPETRDGVVTWLEKVTEEEYRSGN